VLIAACGAGSAVAAQRTWVGHQAGRNSHSVTAQGRTGLPRYYLVRSAIPNDGSSPNRDVTTVRATATGALRARIRCPLSAPYVMTWPVAPVSNQNFFLVCQRATGPAGYDKVLGSVIFRFHVTSSGRVSGEVPVRGGELGAVLVQSIAATPDGSELAVMAYPGNHPPDLHRTPPTVIVIDTRTGRHAIWHGAAPVGGKTVYWPQAISLTADGKELAFLTEPQCFQAGCAVQGGQQMRVVPNPAIGGGQLNSSSLLVQLNSVLRLSSATVMDAVISPGGSRLTLAVMGALSGKVNPDSISVVQIPVSGERGQRLVFRLPTADQYSFFSADPSGSHFLLGTGTPDGPVDGRIDNGRLIALRPAPDVVEAMVW
jgi:hypothetical protein